MRRNRLEELMGSRIGEKGLRASLTTCFGSAKMGQNNFIGESRLACQQLVVDLNAEPRAIFPEARSVLFRSRYR